MLGTVGQGISAMISRLLAVNLPGGDSEEDLANYDAKLKAYQTATTDDEKAKALEELRKAAGVSKTTGRNARKRDRTDEEIQQAIENKIGQYYGSPMFKEKAKAIEGTGTTTQTEDKTGSTTTTSGGLASTRKSNIRIMPMFGDPQSFIEKGEMTEGEYRRKQIEMLQSQIDLLNKINNSTANTDKTTKLTMEEHRAL